MLYDLLWSPLHSSVYFEKCSNTLYLIYLIVDNHYTDLITDIFLYMKSKHVFNTDKLLILCNLGFYISKVFFFFLLAAVSLLSIYDMHF